MAEPHTVVIPDQVALIASSLAKLVFAHTGFTIDDSQRTSAGARLGE